MGAKHESYLRFKRRNETRYYERLRHSVSRRHRASLSKGGAGVDDTKGENGMSSRLQKGLQQETEYWLRQGKLSRFFNGVSDEVINGKRYLLSGDTLAALQESGWIA